jgi:hypothetical protein
MAQHSYTTIVTHHRPGLDEITGNFFLKRYGADWEIIKDTPVNFMANGDFENPPMFEVPGILYNGCGLSSWANEHYSIEYADKSACYLIARELGVNRNKYFDLVTEVTREDRYGSGNIKNHIGQAIKDLYDIGWSYDQVYDWVKTALIALTHQDSRPNTFSMDTETCARAIEKRFGSRSARQWYSIVEKINSWQKGEFIKACAYIDKNPQLFQEVETYKGTMKVFMPEEVQLNQRVGSAARSRGAEIVLMRGGLDFNQVGIVLQQKHTANLSFSRVLKELRQHELIMRGERNGKLINACVGEGTLKVCPIWHGHQSAEGQNTCFAIYNKSKTRPCGPATCLDWDHARGIMLATLQETPIGELVHDYA